MNYLKKYSGYFFVLLLGIFIATGVNLAFAHGADSNLIHSCVGSQGRIRIISSTGSCNGNETPLDWSQSPWNGTFPFVCQNCDLSYDSVGNLFSNKDLSNSVIQLSNFSHQDLTNTILNGGHISQAIFDYADLQGANLSGINATETHFQNANLISSNFTDTNLNGAIFLDSDLSSATLTGADLTNANLQGANMTGASVSGVTWSNTTCPDGTNSDNNGSTCEGHLIL